MLKIGLDLDGVVFDSEATFRVYEEIFDIENNQNTLIDRTEPKYQHRYNWTDEQKRKFDDYFDEVSKESPLKAGFKKVYNLLKDKDIEFIVISARGYNSKGEFMESMEEDAKRILAENNIKFDKYYWKQTDKTEACRKENIDLIIDDDYRVIENLSSNKIKTLYFRDGGMKELKENEYIKEVNNWGDIYRILSSK